MEYSHVQGQSWGLAFAIDGTKYKGTATRMFADQTVFFDVRYNNEDEPISEGYQSLLYASEVNNVIYWISSPQIGQQFADQIGNVLLPKMEERGLTVCDQQSPLERRAIKLTYDLGPEEHGRKTNELVYEVYKNLLGRLPLSEDLFRFKSTTNPKNSNIQDLYFSGIKYGELTTSVIVDAPGCHEFVFTPVK